MISLSSVVPIIVFVLLSASYVHAVSGNFYAIVIDGGSTGSRAFVYHFVEENGEKDVRGMEGQKVSPGISSFSSKPHDAAAYLAPVLIHCKTLIPEEFHNKTIVYFQATAGMRLLSETDQKNIFISLLEGLKQNSEIPFVITEDAFGVIDGRHEAYYAVLASNFIIGRIDTSLKPVEGLPMVGALDMGGSSTQLVFHTGTAPGETVKVDDFWSHSWLSYGVGAVQDRVSKYLIERIEERKASEDERIKNKMNEFKSEIPRIINNPCYPKGYEEYHLENTILFHGTGDSTQCVHIIREVLWPEGGCPTKPCPLDGVVHPPVEGLEFFGMSVYFYAIDCIRHLSSVDLHAWPNPTIDEVEHAVHDFCSLPWSQLHEVKEDHPYTESSQMAHRCLQTLYLGVLLEDAFGFSGDDRGITLALKVEGNEVQWTFGFAIAELLPLLSTSPPVELSLDGSVHEALEGVSHTNETMEALEKEFHRLQHDHQEFIVDIESGVDQSVDHIQVHDVFEPTHHVVTKLSNTCQNNTDITGMKSNNWNPFKILKNAFVSIWKAIMSMMKLTS